MSATTEQVFIDALSLPSLARAELAHKLIASLGDAEPTPDVAQAWAKEAKDRYEAFQCGEITGRDSEVVMRELYQRYK